MPDIGAQSALRLGWCFFNSAGAKSITALVLLGVFPIVVPTIVKLRPAKQPRIGQKHTPYIQYGVTRKACIAAGVVSCIASVATASFWGLVYGLVGEKACDQSSAVVAMPTAYMIAFYVCAGLTLLMFVIFYFLAKSAERQLSNLAS